MVNRVSFVLLLVMLCIVPALSACFGYMLGAMAVRVAEVEKRVSVRLPPPFAHERPPEAVSAERRRRIEEIGR